MGCFILLFSIPLTNTLANELVQYRSKVFSEILNALSDKDKELAEQLVDIRLEQEKKLGILSSSKLIKVQEEPINSVPSDSKSFESQESVTAIHSINSYPTDGTKDFYSSIGNRYIVGYLMPQIINFLGQYHPGRELDVIESAHTARYKLHTMRFRRNVLEIERLVYVYKTL